MSEQGATDEIPPERNRQRMIDMARHMTQALREAATHAANEARNAAEAGNSREAAEWSTAAHEALEALRLGVVSIPDAPRPSPSAVEGELRQVVAAHDVFLQRLATEFSEAGTDTARRVAARIDRHLEGMRAGAPL